jgi:uncharacterized protein (TIGR02145 family)
MGMKNTIALRALLGVISCGQQNSFTDKRDGKTYKTVKIGNQIWMAENLNYEAEGSVCYDNNPENCERNGRLYDWNTAKKICPKGWHLPTDEEFDKLIASAGGEDIAGKYLKSKSGWNDFEGKSGNGLDSYGFSALPSGSLYPDGRFSNDNSIGCWWSSDESNANEANGRSMLYDDDIAYWFSLDKNNKFSVRCVKDN